MISSFRDKRTASVFLGKAPKGFPRDIADSVRRKLRMLDATKSLADLRTPSGNRLEALRGDRAGQHSIRVNDQWRVCFRWHEGNAFDAWEARLRHDVEIVDYH